MVDFDACEHIRTDMIKNIILFATERASNLHVDENYEALQLELEGQQDFQNKMKEGAKMDMRSILFEVF